MSDSPVGCIDLDRVNFFWFQQTSVYVENREKEIQSIKEAYNNADAILAVKAQERKAQLELRWVLFYPRWCLTQVDVLPYRKHQVQTA